jgi:predicted nucleotide-binding protein (sugar kinase/HSP70/actin superfamily)
VDRLACPRVMAAPENIKAGFTRETNVFADHGIRYVSPLVSLGDRRLAAKQLFESLEDVFYGLTLDETRQAVDAGFRALDDFNRSVRDQSREILTRCARAGSRACWCSPGRITWTRASATRSMRTSRPTAIRSSGASTCRPTTTC